ncbi:MAG: hypothetical protein IJ202_08790 [Bacteroidales bacterium]|nr:hypothetical protein [Bacteroidales bacterium]
MDKHYISGYATRTALPRNKRMREAGITALSAVSSSPAGSEGPDWFIAQGDGSLRLNPRYSGLWTDGFLSALGVGPSSGGSGGGADLSDVWESLRTNSDDFADEKIDWGHINLTTEASGSGNVVSGLSLVVDPQDNTKAKIVYTKTNISLDWEAITGKPDLVTTSALNTALTSYVTTSALNTTLASYVTASSLATTLGDYVTDSALALWTGSSKIDTVGTIESGEWQGTPIANAYLANPSVTVGSASITLGNSATLAEIGVTETYLTGLLNSDYHPYGGANDLDLVARYVTASTLTASGAISGGSTISAANSITVGNGSTATTSAAASKRRIYFGSSSYYLELAYDSTLAQFYLHTNAGFAADSFVSTLGVGTPSGGESGGGGIPHVLLTEAEYEALVTGGSVDDGVIYLVYEDES